MNKYNLTPLLSQEEIQKRIKELSQKINLDFSGKDLSIVCVLKGAFIFTADLIRGLTMPVTCEFLRVSSYKNNVSTGSIRVEFDISESIENKHVLLVEDIIDTGKTIRFLIDHLKSKKPASVSVVSLLYKEIDPSIKNLIDYIGFEIPHHYVVGYGMDNEGLQRNLSDIHTLSKRDA